MEVEWSKVRNIYLELFIYLAIGVKFNFLSIDSFNKYVLIRKSRQPVAIVSSLWLSAASAIT